MTRSSNTHLVPPLEDPESALHKKKTPLQELKSAFSRKSGKKTGESSSSAKHKSNLEHLDHTPVQTESEYDTEPEFEEHTSEPENEPRNEMAAIEEMSMGAYKKRIRDDMGPGLVQPAIPATATFELKGHILTALKDIPFFGKDHEDAFKHLDKVNDIADYFNVPNVNRNIVLLRMLPITFKGAAKEWLKALPPGTITTWAQMREQFLDQFCPPSKIAKLKKAIANFEQQPGESLYEAWERYKGLLRNCPQHDLNVQQEMSIFYDGVNVMTRQLLDSQGPLTKKNPREVKELIEEFAKHSREYHNPRQDGIKGGGGAQTEEIAAVMAMLNNMDRRITQMDQSIHAIRVGCERCSGPRLAKDCKMDEFGNRKAQVCYSSGDKFDEDWRKPKKEWLPYEEYKKQKEEKYRQTG